MKTTIKTVSFGGPASAPNSTFAGGSGFSEIVFTVPVVAAGLINTSPDRDLIEYYTPDGELIFETTDEGNSQVDRFVGARSNRSQLIGSIRLGNATGALELDELIFEVQTDDAFYQYDVDATDPDDDELVYSLLDAPDGMLIDASSGIVTWSPESGFGRTNLITNSSFDDGLAGFVTEYGDEPTVAQSAVVTSNPSDTIALFGDFGDNTTGDGNMLLVNGALESGQTVWETTVSVNRNTNYVFSSAYTSAIATSPAQLQFEDETKVSSTELAE